MRYIDVIHHSDQCKIPSDVVPIGSGTFDGDLGGIPILTPWSCDLEGCFWYINFSLTSELVN